MAILCPNQFVELELLVFVLGDILQAVRECARGGDGRIDQSEYSGDYRGCRI
jgi:hypothetical protein